MPVLTDSALYAVLRGNFDAAGLRRERGEVVDTTDWRFGSVQPLVTSRYLGPIIDVESMTACPCGRHWINEDAAQAHKCPAREKG